MLLVQWGGGIKAILIDSYKIVSFYGIHALWYLSSYVIAAWIYLYYVKSLKGLKITAFMVLSFGIGIALSELNKYFGSLFPKMLFPLVNFPITALVRAIVCAAFLAIGRYLYAFLLKERPRIVNGILGILLLLFSFLLSLVSGASNFSIVDYGKFPVLFIFVAISGAVGLLLVLQSFQCKSRMMQYFGCNSLLFLVTHHSLKITYLSVALASIFIPNDNNKGFGIVALIILVGIDDAVIKLIKNCFPWMIYTNRNVLNNVKN